MNCLDSGIDRLFASDVERDVSDIIVFVLTLGSVKPMQTSVHRVPFFGECLCSKQTETAASSGDQHSLVYVCWNEQVWVKDQCLRDVHRNRSMDAAECSKPSLNSYNVVLALLRPRKGIQSLDIVDCRVSRFRQVFQDSCLLMPCALVGIWNQ